MTLQEQHDILQAALEGRAIQYRSIKEGPAQVWKELPGPGAHQYSFHFFEYRLKPEPREWWVSLHNTLPCCGFLYSSKADAQASGHASVILKVREVLE